MGCDLTRTMKKITLTAVLCFGLNSFGFRFPGLHSDSNINYIAGWKTGYCCNFDLSAAGHCRTSGFQRIPGRHRHAGRCYRRIPVGFSPFGPALLGAGAAGQTACHDRRTARLLPVRLFVVLPVCRRWTMADPCPVCASLSDPRCTQTGAGTFPQPPPFAAFGIIPTRAS